MTDDRKKIPEGYTEEQWSKMTPIERMNAKGLIDHNYSSVFDNRKKAEEILRDIIKKNIIIDEANFEYCAKNKIINGFLFAGIRQCMLDYHAQQQEAAMPSEEESEAEVIISTLMAYGKIHTVKGVSYSAGSHEDIIIKAENWLDKLRSRLLNNK